METAQRKGSPAPSPSRPKARGSSAHLGSSCRTTTQPGSAAHRIALHLTASLGAGGWATYLNSQQKKIEPAQLKGSPDIHPFQDQRHVEAVPALAQVTEPLLNLAARLIALHCT